MPDLPAGLVLHCESCSIVIPADALRPEGGDCAFVALNKLAHWYPNETIKGQHAAATAAWRLIYHEAINGPVPDAACVAYWQQYLKDPKKHFATSLARTSLTPDQVQEQMAKMPQGATVKFDFHEIAKARRDAHFYE
jgi:hypothetical protein